LENYIIWKFYFILIVNILISDFIKNIKIYLFFLSKISSFLSSLSRPHSPSSLCYSFFSFLSSLPLSSLFFFFIQTQFQDLCFSQIINIKTQNIIQCDKNPIPENRLCLDFFVKEWCCCWLEDHLLNCVIVRFFSSRLCGCCGLLCFVVYEKRWWDWCCVVENDEEERRREQDPLEEKKRRKENGIFNLALRAL